MVGNTNEEVEAMSQYIPKMRQYPLELWFPEWQYDIDRAEEVARRYEELHAVKYYCQLMTGWIFCRVLDRYGIEEGDGNNNASGRVKKPKGFKEFVMGL